MATGSPSPTSPWRQLLALTLTAARHPGQTLRLLSPERLKNLYVTLFRQNAETRSAIFGFYQQLYREQDEFSGIAKPELEKLPLPELLVFPPAPEHPLASIVVPAYNQFETTLHCLAAVLTHTPRGGYELLLADDGSEDETSRIRQRAQHIRVLRSERNRGFLDTCNRAVAQARGEFVLLLNNDTRVLPGWFEALVGTLQQEPDVGVVGPQLIYPDGRLQEAGGIVWSDAGGYNYGRGKNPERPEYNYARDVDYVSGACLGVRRALWQRIGGFDRRYRPAYYEDTDLAFAVREQGYRVVYRPRARVIHTEGVSHGREGSGGIKRFQAVNRAKFLKKWRQRLASDHFCDSSQLFRARDRAKHRPVMLMVDHHVPFPDRDAGSKSTWQYLRWFVQCGLQVKFIGDNFYRHEPYTSQLEDLGVEVLCGPGYSSGWRDWLQRFGKEIDYAYLHRPHIAIKYIHEIRRLTRAKILYFGHDLHWLRARRRQAVEGASDPLVDWRFEREREFSLFRDCDVIYYPSSVEVDQVRQDFPHKTVRAIPLFVEEAADVQPRGYGERQGLLFVGGFGHPPNLDAVTWLLQSILPRVRERLPEITLTVVGSNLPQQLRAILGTGVSLRENITESALLEAYASARLVVAPLRYGAGVKGKILEALRLQVPVVTTPVGAEGLPLWERPYMAVAEEATDFADELARLYTDSLAWDQLRAQGRLLFNRHFTAAAAAEVLGQDIRLPQWGSGAASGPEKGGGQ